MLLLWKKWSCGQCSSTCNGTTKEEALVKQQLRESIASHDSVKCLFGVFYIEDRSGKMTLDQFKALEHVRHVLNELRQTSKPRKATDTMQMVNF